MTVPARRTVSIRSAPLREADRLNREDWAAVPPEDRLAQVWDLVCEHYARSGIDLRATRLQKSVLSVECHHALRTHGTEFCVTCGPLRLGGHCWPPRSGQAGL